MPVSRESSIKVQKAPAVDPVEALVSTAAMEDRTPTNPQPGSNQSAGSATSEISSGTPVRRGPGRPSKKRRMEPLSTNIEIELRDAVDVYTQEHEMTLIDFLDLAIREKLDKDK